VHLATALSARATWAGSRRTPHCCEARSTVRQPTQLPLVKVPERCEGVEVGISHPTRCRIDPRLRLEWRDQELRGASTATSAEAPPGGAYVKQAVQGSFLGYDIGEMAQRETWARSARVDATRGGGARQAPGVARRAPRRPLVDAIPPSYRLPAAAARSPSPKLEKLAVTPAPSPCRAEAECWSPTTS